jgi:DNA-binding XRE family transcriptional regulator
MKSEAESSQQANDCRPSVARAALSGLVATWQKYRDTLAFVAPAAPEIFRSVRKGLGLTQKEMGQRLGITNVYLSWIETGKQEPSIEVYLKLWDLANEERNERRLRPRDRLGTDPHLCHGPDAAPSPGRSDDERDP